MAENEPREKNPHADPDPDVLTLVVKFNVRTMQIEVHHPNIPTGLGLLQLAQKFYDSLGGPAGPPRELAAVQVPPGLLDNLGKFRKH